MCELKGCLRTKTAARKVISFFITLLALGGCATHDVQKITAHPVSHYPFVKEMERLHVGIDPYFQPDRVKTIFEIDLTSKGVLPVFVVVENRGPSPYLINKKKFSIRQQAPSASEEGSQNPSRVAVDPSAAAQVAEGVAVGHVIASPVTGILSPLLLFITTPIVFKHYENIERSNMTIVLNELPDDTVEAGESLSGFVYFSFKSPETMNLSRKLTVELQFENLSNKNMLGFEFFISQNKGGE